MAEKTINESFKEIFDKLDELSGKKEVKPWDVPWYKRLFRGQTRKNWVLVCFIQENRSISFMKVPIDEGVILLNGIPHTVNSGEILIYKNAPFIIIPSWSIKPFSPTQNQKETEDAGNSSMGWEYLFNYMKKTEIKAVRNFGTMMWFVVGLIVIGGGYYLIKNGGII